MHVVIAHAGAQRDVDLVVEDPQACVADLIAATDGAQTPPGLPHPPDRPGVVVAGRYFGPDIGLDEIGLHEGALLRIADAPDLPARRGTGPLLAVVDGPDAGQLLEIPSTDVLLGRAAHCDLVLDDPTVSGEHARLRLHPDGGAEIVDLGSHNGTWVDGEPVLAPRAVAPGALMRLGAAHARIVTERPNDRPFAVDPLHRATGGLVPFNRPPRPALTEPPAAVEVPEEPTTNQRVRALSLIMVIAPLILGGVLIYIYRDPRFAIFFLLSPVMAVGTWLSSRRAVKKEKRRTGKEFRAALAAFDEQLGDIAVEERARREQLLPHAAETLRRVHTPSMRLWQRRGSDPDFMRLRAGIGDVRWDPPVDAGRDGPPEQAEELITAHSVLARAPVEVDLSGGGVVGLVGTRSAALALARSLVCQAATHHGPADLEVVVLTADVEEWDWAKWLPHVRDEAGTGRRVAGAGESADLAHALLETATDADAPSRFGRSDEPTGPVRLVVVDDPALLEGRRAPARLLLSGGGGPAAGIVLTDTEDRLPAVTTTVIELHSELGDAALRRPQEGGGVDHFTVCGLSGLRAADAARTLARYEDPEVEVPGAGLPSVVRLLPLLGLDEVTPDEVVRRWEGLADDPPPRGPVGVGEDGVVEIDLVRDGPHGLVGGTTGSGKSELLRSLVAALATNVDPDHLVFVLVDYKGGSAFDECARLPHTVGLVTDLDEHLGERALRSLEAELGHRERVLRGAGAADLPAYLAAGAPAGPLPRLVVVVDEFATLAAELPDFLGALVGVAQRGRSLGVHLILATQRPSGTVNANIKANTNLRIALRVQDAADSNDIIDRRDAAAIGRDNPGRAYVRRGPGDVEVVQTALSTAVASPRERRTGVRLLPFTVGATPLDQRIEGTASGPSDLARLVDAVVDAAVLRGGAAPRRPWLPMLPEHVELADVLARERGAVPVPLALADDPDRQRQVVVGWNPAEGHLALFGMVGSGTTTGLLTVVRALVETLGPDECHLYAIDFGANALREVRGLPHVGGVISASDREAQHRLFRHLRAEVDRRRALSPDDQAGEPLIVVLIDGIAAFLAEHEGVEGAETADGFKRVFGDGPGVRICCVVAGDRPGAMPMRLSSLVSQKLLFRLADSGDFSSIGVRGKNLPAFVPGRALHSDSKLVLQLGHPGDMAALTSEQVGRPSPSRPPVVIRSLPAEVRAEALVDVPRATPERLCLPVGIADEDLGTAELELYPVDHVLVAGPTRSGKSSLLRLLAEQTRRADPDAVLVGICDERSPLFPLELLDAAGPLAELVQVVRAAQRNDRRWVLFVDDAPLVDDPDDLLTTTLKLRRPGLHVVAAGRSDDVRSAYGHWTREVRQSRTGVLLQPNLSTDGELLGLKLPRRLAVPLLPGRGFVVSAGQARLAQLALPDDDGGRLAARTAPVTTSE